MLSISLVRKNRIKRCRLAHDVAEIVRTYHARMAGAELSASTRRCCMSVRTLACDLRCRTAIRIDCLAGSVNCSMLDLLCAPLIGCGMPRTIMQGRFLVRSMWKKFHKSHVQRDCRVELDPVSRTSRYAAVGQRRSVSLRAYRQFIKDPLGSPTRPNSSLPAEHEETPDRNRRRRTCHRLRGLRPIFRS